MKKISINLLLFPILFPLGQLMKFKNAKINKIIQSRSIFQHCRLQDRQILPVPHRCTVVHPSFSFCSNCRPVDYLGENAHTSVTFFKAHNSINNFSHMSYINIYAVSCFQKKREEECIPVGCVPAARRPYAGV